MCTCALAAAAILLGVLNAGGNALDDDGYALTVRANEGILRQYTMDEIKALPQVSVEKTIVSGSMGKNSGKADESGVFTGVAMETLMADADPAWENYGEFVMTVDDGFTSAVFLSEIKKGGNVIIAYEKDGEPIPGADEGGLDPLRVVIADDEFGNRSAWHLKTIEARE